MPSNVPLPPRAAAARRRFLRRSAAGAAGLLVARGALAGPSGTAAGASAHDFWQAVPGSDPFAPPADARRLALLNAHTGESFEGVYRTDGAYEPGALANLAHLMRDHRADREHEIDPGLYDILHDLHAGLPTDEPFRVLSAYRTPETNAKLRKRSSGVSRYSLHMEGRAADIHLPGIGTGALRDAATALRAGGVGYYSRSGFIHVDTGAVRSWGS